VVVGLCACFSDITTEFVLTECFDIHNFMTVLPFKLCEAVYFIYFYVFIVHQQRDLKLLCLKFIMS
jgi:hypothetical protein